MSEPIRSRDCILTRLTHLREKIEENPSAPELLITESGVGYRLMVR
jgi:DNA-binding response OmpR family regulator